jgi:pilus assembly protein Flp/PilA
VFGLKGLNGGPDFHFTVKETKQMNDVLLQNTEAEEKKQKGASLVEYALLVALIAVIAIVAIRAVGTKVSSRFSQINSTLL